MNKMTMLTITLSCFLQQASGFQVSPPTRVGPSRKAAVSEYESVVVDAKVEGLRGTLFRAGPCSEDGDGMVIGVTFSDDGCIVRSRFVRTEKFVRGKGEHLANGGVCYWNGRLYALHEGKKPYQIDPLSCGTQKLSELGGMLSDNRRSFDKVKTTQNRLFSFRTERNLFAETKTVDVFDENFKLVDEISVPSDTIDFAPVGEKIALLTPKGIEGQASFSASKGDSLVEAGVAIVGGCLVVDGKKAQEAHAVDGVIASSPNRLFHLKDDEVEWRPDDAGVFVGAPSVVDDEFVVALLHRQESTELGVWKINDLSEIVARIPFPSHLPPLTLLRGFFVKELTPTLKEIQNSETLARLYARKSREWNEIEAGFSGIGIKQFLFPKGVSGG